MLHVCMQEKCWNKLEFIFMELNFADNQDSNENNGESSDYFEPDDESTIDEQETFEALNNEVVTNQENEIHVLEQVRKRKNLVIC